MPTNPEPSDEQKMRLVSKLSIEDQWKILAKHIFNFEPSTVQYEETRKAYFCGFSSAFSLMTNISAELPEDEAMVYMDKLQAEITAYENKIRAQVERMKAQKN